MRRRVEHEFAVQTNLDWEIETQPIYVKGKQLAGYKALIRSDNDHPLNVCKKSYTPVTNEKFKDTVGQIAKFSGFEFDRFYEFKKGKVLLAFLKNREKLKIAEWEAQDYMVIGNTHDSTRSFFCGSSQILTRCMNAFSALSRHNFLTHSKSINEKIDDLILYYQAYIDERDAMKKTFENWRGISMSAELINSFAETLLEVTDKSGTKKQNQMKGLSLSIAKEIEAMGSNALGLFNGVTHYTTHVRGVKEKVFGNAVGSNADLNTKAFALMTEMVAN